MLKEFVKFILEHPFLYAGVLVYEVVLITHLRRVYKKLGVPPK